jgi:hypothetical protein
VPNQLISTNKKVLPVKATRPRQLKVNGSCGRSRSSPCRIRRSSNAFHRPRDTRLARLVQNNGQSSANEEARLFSCLVRFVDDHIETSARKRRERKKQRARARERETRIAQEKASFAACEITFIVRLLFSGVVLPPVRLLFVGNDNETCAARDRSHANNSERRQTRAFVLF